MGSFRSQPELTKHSEEKKGQGLTYASTHMCGMPSLMQVGGFTWRMLTSAPLRSQIRRTLSLECSTDMEVYFYECRPRSVNFCGTPFYPRIREKPELWQKVVLKSTQRGVPQNGLAFADRRRQNRNHCYPKIDERER